MGSNDLITVFFLVAAVLIFLQLRSVLGRRTGHEKPPVEPFGAREAAKAPSSDEGKLVTLPKRGDGETEDRFARIDAFAPQGTDLNRGLREAVQLDASFDPREFIDGARMAYEMIVTAFANGDRKMLKSLLSQEVFEGFEAAIADRESRGETLKSTFVGIEKAEITQVSTKATEIHITMRILSQLISATYDRAGTVIDGDAEAVSDANDLWTFARDTRSRDPNWKLIATESER